MLCRQRCPGVVFRRPSHLILKEEYSSFTTGRLQSEEADPPGADPGRLSRQPEDDRLFRFLLLRHGDEVQVGGRLPVGGDPHEVAGKGQASTKIVDETIRISESFVKRGIVRKVVDEILNIAEGILRLIGWREMLAGASPVTLDLEGDSAITTTLSGHSLLED